jgi:hypothetical protein
MRRVGGLPLARVLAGRRQWTTPGLARGYPIPTGPNTPSCKTKEVHTRLEAKAKARASWGAPFEAQGKAVLLRYNAFAEIGTGSADSADDGSPKSLARISGISKMA